MLSKAAEQRYTEFTTGEGIFQNYLPVRLAADADPVTREFWDFYPTPRGIAIPAGRTLGQTLASEVRFVNFYPFNDIQTISPRPMLFIAGIRPIRASSARTPIGGGGAEGAVHRSGCGTC